jgi:hypothetical protein
MKKLIFALLFLSSGALAQTKHALPVSGGGTGMTTAGYVLTADSATTGNAPGGGGGGNNHTGGDGAVYVEF